VRAYLQRVPPQQHQQLILDPTWSTIKAPPAVCRRGTASGGATVAAAAKTMGGIKPEHAVDSVSRVGMDSTTEIAIASTNRRKIKTFLCCAMNLGDIAVVFSQRRCAAKRHETVICHPSRRLDFSAMADVEMIRFNQNLPCTVGACSIRACDLELPA
jgi:hypothetical protein